MRMRRLDVILNGRSVTTVRDTSHLPGESLMEVGYVVLYVNDAEACRDFWVEQVGMVEKKRFDASGFTIV